MSVSPCLLLLLVARPLLFPLPRPPLFSSQRPPVLDVVEDDDHVERVVVVVWLELELLSSTMSLNTFSFLLVVRSAEKTVRRINKRFCRVPAHCLASNDPTTRRLASRLWNAPQDSDVGSAGYASTRQASSRTTCDVTMEPDLRRSAHRLWAACRCFVGNAGGCWVSCCAVNAVGCVSDMGRRGRHVVRIVGYGRQRESGLRCAFRSQWGIRVFED
ncbi:hypothetical protein DFP72DRAFT_1140058 [Ephemerocybe angulata]|uniref:Secreted protein n=1 Tax=Ephemerocybe angulata TaxID=980116 RepID=A0A8H6M1Q8_9AGAR|nr:hypothetical protein DFP72DRAFT_1140058 [Tulosesus angulatus]